MDEGLTYKSSGVDIEAGYRAVQRIKALAQATLGPEALLSVGGFGGAYALGDGAEAPVLVAGCDGVGTKLRVAFMTGRHDTIGIDAVAYCVNDILCHGARPLFFLDYVAVGKMDPEQVEAIVRGVADGCRQAGCALLGGETAEMPGFYPAGEYDIAGFAVGIVPRNRLIDGSRVRPGDCIIGLASSGLHSSGYSLARRALLERARMDLGAFVPKLGRTLADELLEPTAIYVRPVLELCRRLEVRGIANITGGGVPENLPRAMAPGTRARLEWGAWPVPAVFELIREAGNVTPDEMLRTFNLGLGMAVIVPRDQEKSALECLALHGQKAWVVGRVEEGDPGVDVVGYPRLAGRNEAASGFEAGRGVSR
ncbi:MAG: phosphoribosylformylglycinamidine cyclo-ligase [Firmicutes bacterium]|nr:phosphoribosylformylglycinamidine cyclo-ligase [Bacillota bacterium]